MSLVTLVETTHIGRLGEYAEMAAHDGLIIILAAGGFGVETPAAVPHGGRAPILHTNPIAMGFPSGDAPMIVDFATTTVAGGKVMLALSKGQEVPPGCIVDSEGRPTTNPADLFAGGAHLRSVGTRATG